MIKYNNVAVVVPAHNEGQVISTTLDAILKLVDCNNLYVFDDGSEDNTRMLSLTYTNNVLTLPNHGKAQTLNTGIKYFNLTKKYQYILFMDADTQPKYDFLEQTIKHFEIDNDNKIICVVGRVKGYGVNWLSKYRQWEYQISHLIHKRAQHFLKSIVVVPGCATVYRSFIFDILDFPVGTLTEDMDFTFMMHRNGYNNMVFEDKAVVHTQDPQKLKDYIKQLTRWYTGFWQIVRKHNIPWQGQILDFEVGMLAVEGLYNGLLVILIIISITPLTLINELSIFRIPIALDFFLFFLPTLIWSSVSDRDYSRILYIPHFYFLRLLSCLIFFTSFFKGYLSIEKEYSWQNQRYAIRKEEI